MKKIIYTRNDGQLCVVSPTEGGRLAKSVTLENGSFITSNTPLPVDKFCRGWPVAGAVVDWAETEDEWLARISLKDVPKDSTDVQIVDESAIPKDRTFRNAWKAGVNCIEHDITKCKSIAHDRRRAKREDEFKPHDEVIAKQIPGKSVEDAEAARVVIRQKYADIQTAIDSAKTVEEIKASLL